MSRNHARIACILYSESTVRFYINVFDPIATQIVIRIRIAIQILVWIAIQTRITIQIFFWIAIHSVRDHDADRRSGSITNNTIINCLFQVAPNVSQIRIKA